MGTIWTSVAKEENDDILYFPKHIENKRYLTNAPVAQLDRAFGYGPEGCRFESCRAHGFHIAYSILCKEGANESSCYLLFAERHN